jgi:hypothetical protein
VTGREAGGRLAGDAPGSQVRARRQRPPLHRGSDWCPGQELDGRKSDVEFSASPSSLTLEAARTLVLGVWTFLRVLLGRSTAVTLENVALRHQLMVLQRSSPRPRLRRLDHILWVPLTALGELASSLSLSSFITAISTWPDRPRSPPGGPPRSSASTGLSCVDTVIGAAAGNRYF